MKKLAFWPIAWTLSVFVTVIYLLDMLLGVLFPNWWVMWRIYEFLLPGFTFISWGTFFLGLVEAFLAGFFTALVFVPIYNFFVAREVRARAPTMMEVGEHH